MYKIIKHIIIYLLIAISAYGLFKLTDKYQLSILKSNIECTIITKGCNEGTALVSDNESIYIAENNKIKKINNEGKQKIIYSSDNNIEDIIIKDSFIYILSDKKLIKFNPNNKEEEIIFSSIPLSGNNINRKLLLVDNKIYITIGTKTNSGVFKDGSYEYISNEENGIINNGCIYEYNIDNYEIRLFASGIRGVVGIDSNSKGEIYAIFSGMKNEGIRAINRDKDYIYKIEKSKWYGFPDFSGGDYINSPRFADKELITPILEHPISKVVDGPIFVDRSIDNIKELSIDKEGVLLPKDSIIYWNKERKMIIGFVDKKYNIEVLKVTEKSEIKDIIYTGEEFLLLDSGVGCIFSLHNKNGIEGFNLPIKIWIYIVVLILSIAIVLINKNKEINKKGGNL